MKPLKNKIIFQFEDNVKNRMFEDTTNWGFTITKNPESTIQNSRYGIIKFVGPEVEEYQVGDQILIETLAWTESFNYLGEKFWQTDDTRIIGKRNANT